MTAETIGGIKRDLRTSRIAEADAYLAARTGSYAQRCVRYDAALSAMYDAGLGHDSTIVDVGSGWGELAVRLHTFYGSLARYYPVDACLDGTDLDEWFPPRRAEFFVALEVIEHLRDPIRLLEAMQGSATRAVIVSTPNPATTDVLGMDPTHRTEVHRPTLEACGFTVSEKSFYGAKADSLLGVWRP